MNRRRRRRSNGADRERLLYGLLCAVVACHDVLQRGDGRMNVSLRLDDVQTFSLAHLDNRLHLSQEASRPTLYERYPGSDTHPVDPSTRVKVVQRIEDDVEALCVRGMRQPSVSSAPLPLSLPHLRLLTKEIIPKLAPILNIPMMRHNVRHRLKRARHARRDYALALLDVRSIEQELSVQVREVNCV